MPFFHQAPSLHIHLSHLHPVRSIIIKHAVHFSMFLIFFKQIEIFSKFSSCETNLFVHISATLLRQIKDTISSLQVLLVDPEVQQHPLVPGLPALPVETQAEMFEELLLFLLSHVVLSLLSQPPKLIYTQVEIKQSFYQGTRVSPTLASLLYLTTWWSSSALLSSSTWVTSSTLLIMYYNSI